MVWEAWYCYTTIFFLSILSFHRLTRNRVVPLRWPVLGMLPGLLANVHRLHDYATSLLGESGGTFMFRGPWFMGLDFILTCDPANAKHMYNTRFTDYPKGDQFLEIFDGLGNGILSVDGDMWSKQRRMAVARISTHKFRASVAENSRDKVHKALLPILDGMAGLDRVLDLQDVMKRFSMDVTSRQLLGKDPGSLAHDFPDIPFPKAVEDGEEVFLYRHVVPMAWWKLLRWLQFGEGKRMAMAMSVIDRYIADALRRRDQMKLSCCRRWKNPVTY
ncbi:alkane hydroxylase MAH1-like [Iris pallida]|uniref:noroxomaritidine synthase n=1 Tax=Iris pallida TaxID=29817 RepID=A0AAX6DRY6_IRIPA|nr:alkane hydroxylase MAH1-like [Iris pallida]